MTKPTQQQTGEAPKSDMATIEQVLKELRVLFVSKQQRIDELEDKLAKLTGPQRESVPPLKSWQTHELGESLHYQTAVGRNPDSQYTMSYCAGCGGGARGGRYCAKCLKAELERRGLNRG